MDIRNYLIHVVVLAAVWHGYAEMTFPALVITNGLRNICMRCEPHGCVTHTTSPLKPSFYERKTERLELELAAALAISYSRHELADGLTFPKKHTYPTQIKDLSYHPLPYFVNGVSLTNMVMCAFPFAAHAVLATNDLNIVLVAFYCENISQDNFLYALYVNDHTGNVANDIRGCSGFMEFLSNGVRYPFLGKIECERQDRFFSSLYDRKYGPLKKKPNHGLCLTAEQREAIGERDIEVELVDPQ